MRRKWSFLVIGSLIFLFLAGCRTYTRHYKHEMEVGGKKYCWVTESEEQAILSHHWERLPNPPIPPTRP